MFSSKVAERLALRHRRKLIVSICGCGKLLLFGIFVLAVTAGPTYLLGWNNLFFAGIGAAIFVLVWFTVVLMLPLEFIAYVGIYFDQTLVGIPFPGFSFGRGLYRESGRLDEMARKAGLRPLSEFESPDVVDTGEPPNWHHPESALPTVEHLLTQTDSSGAVHRDLRHVQAALRLANEKGARFYLLLLTWSGFTNAEFEALRRGERL